jgi:hypothetical protein
MLRALIMLSLVANVALATIVLLRPAPAARLSAGDDLSASSRDSAGASPHRVAALADSPTLNPEFAALRWSKLHSTGSLAELVARLRSAGFPTPVIRAVVSGALGQEYIDRRKELTKAEADLPFWKDPFTVRDPKAAASIRALGREHAAIVRELFGPEAVDEFDEWVLHQQHLYGGVLSPEKIQRVQEIARDYNDLRAEIYSARVLFPEDREALAKLEQEQRADLAAVLSPEELEAHDLRTSNTANMLRWQASALDLTEAEFRALYRAAIAVEQQLGSNAETRSPNAMREKAERIAQQLGGVLPPERLQQFVEASDPQFAQTARLVARLQLPPSVTRDVVAIQKDAMERFSALARDSNSAPEARQALAREVTEKLSAKLGGARGVEAYKLNGGQWMNTLTAPARNAPPR